MGGKENQNGHKQDTKVGQQLGDEKQQPKGVNSGARAQLMLLKGTALSGLADESLWL
ncbi:hypothetical protein GCM10023185_17360 [Hymenobacter saemangeumensis]|uniref:Uncharacterized protein n=1 Tax=Hymenobacter saemangeumensis TaxID=1084522 RepID=A0ABP8IBB1_9BACT